MHVLADAKRVSTLIQGLSTSIARDLDRSGASGSHIPWALVGIRSRGDLLAKRLAELLNPDHLGTLDITLYRDDLSEIGNQAIVRTTEITFPLDGLNVVLVDDVLMTGRSIRAALQSLIDLGRPRRVWLSVLVDRGGRELPIAPDHVGLDMTVARGPGRGEPKLKRGDLVDVYLEPADRCDAIVVRGPDEQQDGPA